MQPTARIVTVWRGISPGNSPHWKKVKGASIFLILWHLITDWLLRSSKVASDFSGHALINRFVDNYFVSVANNDDRVKGPLVFLDTR